MDDFFGNQGNDQENEINSSNENKSIVDELNEIKNGEYSYIPPRSEGEYVTPPQPKPEPPKQENNYGYMPPNYNNYYPPKQAQPQNPFAQNGYNTPINSVPVPPAPKKKNKSVTTLIIIIVISAIVAVSGMVIAANSIKSGDSKGNKESTTASQKADGDAQASVEKSGEAAKKDKNGNLTVAGVTQENVNSCVGITVFTNQSGYEYFYGYGSNQQNSDGETASGEGSGVIMSESNGKTYIMTCAHVIADGSSFKVTLENGDEYDAEMVGSDSQTDIGVLSIKATGLQIAKFGDSDDIEVGEDCVAIGCPGGLEFMNSVTKGIVSALARPIQSSIGYSNTCIQVDAAINPGNSGGALFNMQGQVIGINSSKIASTEYEGMGFAVPSNTAVETANSLIKNGYVKGRAKLGIEYLTLENFENADAILGALEDKGFKKAKGTMVIQNVTDDSDLKNKDVKKYDMIVAVDGKTLTSTDVLTSLLSKKSPGDTITLKIARIEGDSMRTFDVKCKLIESK